MLDGFASQDSHAPIKFGFAGVAPRISEVAEIALSGPIVFCKSAIASISASLALLRASDIALPCAELRKVTVDNDKIPIATNVSNTKRLIVMIRVKPRDSASDRRKVPK